MCVHICAVRFLLKLYIEGRLKKSKEMDRWFIEKWTVASIYLHVYSCRVVVCRLYLGRSITEFDSLIRHHQLSILF
jgi:hypothetical protein